MLQVDGGVSAAHKAFRGFQNTPIFNAHWFKDVRLKELATQLTSPAPLV
jgi:predicted N-acyltransferase